MLDEYFSLTGEGAAAQHQQVDKLSELSQIKISSRSTNKNFLEFLDLFENQFENSLQQAQTPVQSQTPGGADQGRQRPVFTLGPRSNASPIQVNIPFQNGVHSPLKQFLFSYASSSTLYPCQSVGGWVGHSFGLA